MVTARPQSMREHASAATYPSSNLSHIELEMIAMTGTIEAALRDAGVDDAATRGSIVGALLGAREGERLGVDVPAGVREGAEKLAALSAARRTALGAAPSLSASQDPVGVLRKHIDDEFGAGFADRLFSSERFRVVANEDDLPSQFRHPAGGVVGVNDDATDTTWLVARWISREAVRGVLLHEIGVHYGLRQMLGGRARELFAQARALADAGDPIAVAARSRVPVDTLQANVDEELLAYMVQERASIRQPFMRRVRSQIKGFLFRLGVDVRLTPQDMTALAEGSLHRVARVEGKPGFSLLGHTRAVLRKCLGAGLARPEVMPLAYARDDDVRRREIDPVALDAVAKRFSIPPRSVEELISRDVHELRDRDRFLAPSNHYEVTGYPRFELGAAKMGSYHHDLRECYVEFLDEFDPHMLVNSESEDRIKCHATYQRYVEMLHEGHEPPYIHAFENERGVLVSINRRRTLAAQEFATRNPGHRIKGWHGMPNHETGNPLKYGDVLAAYDEALALGVANRPVRGDTASQVRAQLARWIDGSAIVNQDGTARRLYHGTNAVFGAFRPNAKGLIFISPEPHCASSYALGDGANVIPVYVRAIDPFNGENAAHVRRVLAHLDREQVLSEYDEHVGTDFDDSMIESGLAGNDWFLLELPCVLQAIRKAGFDGFWTWELGESGLAVFEPAQLKSALGNSTFEPGNADIRFLRQTAEKHQQVNTDAFRSWFGESAIADDSGAPLVVYHGTGEDFTSFDKGMLGSATGMSDAKQGFFFALDPAVADEFAWKNGERGSVMPVYLSMKNPYITDFTVHPGNSREYAAIIARARAEGYDGVASFGLFLGKETSVFVAFEPTQIKSALGNNGLFDPTNSDIRFSRAAKGELFQDRRAENAPHI